MAYVSLYRKYRSQSFGEVIGQNHVTTVLQNAIRHGRIAHAYLFCGPRGCGKTSTARLLARALNCAASSGPTPEPCGTCDLCRRIRDGSCMDVIEMDAASETGIDDVREKIIENAKYAPGEARYKVYIIDEVHDLSLKAFDSLLKTIEEPPAHVIFILATTEAHKVPITVRSRCQRLDFRRGTMDDLVSNLVRVLDAEKIVYKPDAIAALARAAEGSFRDSLSLLEQVLAYADEDGLTAEAVHEAVGMVGPEMLDEITEVIASDDMGATCRKATELVDSGKDIKQLLVAMQGHLADLIKAQVARGPGALADVSPERFAHLKLQSAHFSPPQLLRMMEVLAEAERDIRFTNQHSVLLMRAFWTILPTSIAALSAPVQAAAAPIRAPVSRTAVAPLKAVEPAEEKKAPVSQAKPALVESPAPETSGAPGGQPPAIDLDGMKRVWPKVIRRFVEVVPMAAAFMQGTEVKDLRGAVVVVGFPDTFTLDRVDKPKGRAAVEDAIASVLNASGLKVKCELKGSHTISSVPTAEGGGSLDFAPQGEVAAVVDRADENGASDASAVTVGAPAQESLLDVVIQEFRGTLVKE